MSIGWRRAWVVLLIVLSVLGCIGYGSYQYLLHHYARQIDNLLSDLINDSEADQSQQPAIEVPKTGEEAPQFTHSESLPESEMSTDNPAHASSGTVIQTQSSKPESTDQRAEATEPSSDPVSGAVAQAAAGLNLSDSEMDMVGDLPSLLGQMTSDEKLMLVKTLMKFSPNELLRLYRLYEGGDVETKAQVKEQIKAKFSAEDIELIKQMAAKYR